MKHNVAAADFKRASESAALSTQVLNEYFRPAEQIVGENNDDCGLPVLVINESNLTATAKELAGLIVKKGLFLSNGFVPVKIVAEENRLPRAIEVTAEIVRVHAHEICRPVKLQRAAGRPKKGEKRVVTVEKPTTLSSDISQLYLKGLEGSWGLKPFYGITTAPILKNDGSKRISRQL